MKRVNVFLDEKTIEVIKEYQEEIAKNVAATRWKKATNSDLIRFALSRTFGTKFVTKHIPNAVMETYVGQIRIKRAAEDKSA